MDLEEIKQLKTDLRVEIAKLIATFEWKTEVKVVDLEVLHIKTNLGEPDIVQVIAKIDLG